MDLTITTTGNATAGEEININCTVTKRVDGLQNSPTVGWIGQVQDNVETSTTGQSAVLSVNNLSTSHGKSYTCQGSVESRALTLNEPFFVMENHHLVVKSKCELNQLT